MTDDIELFKLGKLISKKHYDNIQKESDEIYWMFMSDDKESNERDWIDKNDEERVTNDIWVLKLGKLDSQKIQTILRNKLDGYDWW